jgi:malate dehydrogenase
VAGARFTNSLLRALKGDAGVTECAFVATGKVPGASYFATRVSLDKNGVKDEGAMGTLSPFEKEALAKLLPELKASIDKGVAFAHKA